MPTSTTTASPVITSPRLASLREQVKLDLSSENFNKYSVASLIHSIKVLGDRGKEYEDAGDLTEAYKMYYKAAELFSVVINHREYQESQKQKGDVYKTVFALQKTIAETVIAPAHRVSDRLKQIELRRDTPIMPGTTLPFTIPITPPASSAGSSTPLPTPPPPMSPVPREAPRSLADRMSMLRMNGLSDGATPEGSAAGSTPLVNGKRLSKESFKSASPVSSPRPPSFTSGHLPTSSSGRSLDVPSLLPSPSILPSSSSSRSLASLNEQPETPPPNETSPRPALLPTESQFNEAFPSLSTLEASFPVLPTVPTGLPSLPSAPTNRPGVPSSSTPAGLPPSRFPDPPVPPSLPPFASSRSPPPRSRTPPKIPPKPSLPLSPHPSGSRPAVPGRPPSTASVRSNHSGGAAGPSIPTSITPKELYGYLRNDTHPILLLDVREQRFRASCRIAIPSSGRSSSVHVEPLLLTRSSLTSRGLEDALSLNPQDEIRAFSRRSQYAMVVMYDDASTSLAQSASMSALIKVIFTDEFAPDKKLDKPPIVLVGGLRAWRAEFGDEGLEGEDVRGNGNGNGKRGGYRAEEGRLPAISERPGRGRIEASRDERGRSSLDQLPNRIWSPGPPPMSPTEEEDGASDVRLQRKHAISRSQATTRLNSMYRNGESISGSSDYSSPSLASSPVSPSGYGMYYQSMYNQPGASSSTALGRSYPEGTPLPAPPQASATPPTLMSRRRSDYAEQSQYPYTGAPPPARAAIDYPQLNVHAAPVITPPPAVAASSLERHSSHLHPRAGSQYTSQYTVPPSEPSRSPGPVPNGYPGSTATSTKMVLAQPRIPSDWPVQFWADQAISASGLKNLGNTCYMNAPLQCLSATIPFARFFLENRWQMAVNTVNPLGTHGQLAGAFAKMLSEMWKAQYSFLSPVNFRKSVCQFARQFAGSDQHDAQEFTSFLLDGLHEDLNRIIEKPHAEDPTPAREAELETLPQQIAAEQEWKLYQTRNDSIIVDYFQGQFRNRMQCMTCLKTSTTYNPFMYLSLPIPSGRGMSKVSLQQCLDAFVKEEVMEKADAWHCPNCKVLRKATKRLSISRLPPVLLIHLKRFSFKGPFTDKLETLVDFPLRGLDLTNYMPPPLPPGVDKGQPNNGPVRLDDPRAQIPPYKYDLYAVTNHFGSLSNGHYTAFIASRGSWVYCDDSRLTNAEGREIVAKPAYILFYKRVRS